MTPTLRFRRIIFGFRPGAMDRELLEISAEMADMLGAALQGVFIEDESLMELAASFRMREFHLLRREWREVEAARMVEDIRLAARSAKQLFQEIALERGITSVFDVLGGSSVQEFLRSTHARDILVVSSPGSPLERLAEPEAFSSPSSTKMLVPRRVQRRKGPVVALTSPTGNSVLRIAASIAQAANERLVLVAAAERTQCESLLNAANSIGLARSNVEVRALPSVTTQNFLSAIEQLDERVIILPRSKDGAEEGVDAAAVASVRSAPVILVDPSATFEA
jgi:hypothetical protein